MRKHLLSRALGVVVATLMLTAWTAGSSWAVETQTFCISGDGNGTSWTYNLESSSENHTVTVGDPPPDGSSAGTLAQAWVDSINDIPVGYFSADYLGVSDDNGYFRINYISTFTLSVGTCTVTGNPSGCTFNPTVIEAPFPAFERGDANDDGNVDVSDPSFISDYLFNGGDAPPCFDAADANDDGAINISDPVYLNNYLFQGGPAPPSPGPSTCGGDPTADTLDCDSSSVCQ